MALSFLLSGWFGTDNNSEQWFGCYRDTGNIAHLERLIALHGDALYHFLARQSDKVLAEDVSQQSWLKLIEQPYSFSGNSSFKTWLFSVARHCLIDELRRRQRWHTDALDEVNLVDDNPCLVQQLQLNRQKMQLSEQLQLLPFLQREALMLQLEGFSLQQISEITLQPVETIKSRLRYAKQCLQQLSGGSDDNA